MFVRKNWLAPLRRNNTQNLDRKHRPLSLILRLALFAMVSSDSMAFCNVAIFSLNGVIFSPVAFASSWVALTRKERARTSSTYSKIHNPYVFRVTRIVAIVTQMTTLHTVTSMIWGRIETCCFLSWISILLLIASLRFPHFGFLLGTHSPIGSALHTLPRW